MKLRRKLMKRMGNKVRKLNLLAQAERDNKSKSKRRQIRCKGKSQCQTLKAEDTQAT